MLLKITASPIFDLDRDWGGIGESSMMERGGQFFGGGKSWSKGMPPQLVRNSGTHGWLQSPPTLTLEWMDGVHSKKASICKILCKIFQITIMKTEKACSLLNISTKRFHAMLNSMNYILFMWSSLGFPLVTPLPPLSKLFNPIWETLQSNYSSVPNYWRGITIHQGGIIEISLNGEGGIFRSLSYINQNLKFDPPSLPQEEYKRVKSTYFIYKDW